MKKKLLMFCIAVCMMLTACEEKTEEADANQKEDIPSCSEVILYQENGVELKLEATVSVDTIGEKYVLTAKNENEEQRMVSVKGWVLNDKINLGAESVLYVEPKSEDTTTIIEMREVLFLENEDTIHKLQCQVTLKDENYEILDERECEVELQDEVLKPAVRYNTFLGAKAEKQVLAEEDGIKLTLQGWGKCPDENYVRGVVLAENQTEETIPVLIDGIMINGIFFDVFDNVNFLESGGSCYSVCSSYIQDIEEVGISAITDVALLILTSEEQNTGTISYGGGKWYPIVLSEQGETDTVLETGELLMETEDVEIYLLSQEEMQWSSGGGVYKWKLSVVNKCDENISVSVIDINEEIDRYGLYMSDSDVGANAQRYVYINMNYSEWVERPEISFRIQIRSMAGGSVLYTGEERITLTPDEK